MEKKTFLCLLILSIVMTFATCKKGIPVETHTGADTFGCYLNGELVTPRGGGIAPNHSCYYQQLAPGDSGYVFHVSGADYKIPTSIKAIAINVGGIKIKEGMTIPLNKGNDYKSGRGQCTYENSYFGHIYYTNDTTSGFIHVSKFDKVNQIASGTFAFKAINAVGDSVNITDGRFDMKFTR